jgi:hypothetical protein
MDSSGAFDTMQGKNGYCWTYTTPGGAMLIGHDWHTTKTKALNAGKKWLKERQQ